MYHSANSKIDQVTNSATDKNIIEKKSNLKLIKILKELMFIHSQSVIITSNPWSIKIERGIRLIKKANLMVVLMWWWLSSLLIKVSISGIIRIKRVRSDEDEVNKLVITFTWTCTKRFWLLRSMDNYFPLKVKWAMELNHGS